jgi:hypothetical protein
MNRRSAGRLVTLALLAATTAWSTDVPSAVGRRSLLPGDKPDGTILRHDIDGDGKPDILERWWNGKRVRWLDENHDLKPDDTFGDLTGDVLQVDMDGDGLFDGPTDMNVKWIDSDHDGVADVQTFAINPKEWLPGPNGYVGGPHWMVFINHDRRGVLGWVDWSRFNFDCWGYGDTCDWLPNYHDGDFLKVHVPPGAIQDPRLNWENPFSFFDLDGDGVSEMALRWCVPRTIQPDGSVVVADRANEAFVTFDLDNDSGKGNESDFDMSLRGFGGSGVAYQQWAHRIEALKGEPRFDGCFQWNNWRRIDEVLYVPRDKSYDTFFSTRWGSVFFTFDEDDDDHRWERVELMYPTDPTDKDHPADPWSTQRWLSRRTNPADAGKPAGLGGNRQADSLGDRGEFDLDGSGRGRLYVGRFDRKLHLFGAEWGAWTVDRTGQFHGGWSAPSPRPSADKVAEVVRYTDTDGNGFIDRVEFDYDGDRTIDLMVDLLAWKTAENPHPDEVEILETRTLGWKGLHERFLAMAEQSWQEALLLHRAAWRRGLGDAETDRLAVAATYGERYDHAYWLKETLLRRARVRLAEVRRQTPAEAETLTQLDRDLVRSFYLGDFTTCATLLARIPGI